MLTGEFYKTMRANGWDPVIVDSLTLRQLVYGWSMVHVYERDTALQMANAGRAAQAQKSDFEKWLQQMGY